MGIRINSLGVSPNFRRQAFYVAIALAAVVSGYGAGLMFKTDRQGTAQVEVSTLRKSPTETKPNTGEIVHRDDSWSRSTGGTPNTAVYPDPVHWQSEMPVRAYEEALPSEVYEYGLKGSVAGEPPKPEGEAMLRQPDVAAEPPDEALLPPWRRYAVAFPEAGTRPMVVIVIDDLGLDRKRTARAIGLKGPLTLSFLAYAEDLKEQTAIARDAGHELLLHVGMEPISESVDPGPNVLLTGLGSEEIRRLLEWNLGQIEGYVGINNHMGSLLTRGDNLISLTSILARANALSPGDIESRLWRLANLGTKNS